MKVSSGRINRVYEGLTARERAVLVLRAWKKGEDEDLMVRLTMPGHQAREFNRLIDLMNAVNQSLGPLILLLHERRLALSQRLGWLGSLTLFDSTIETVRWFIAACVKQPLTREEWQRARRRAEDELIPAEELAEEEADEYEDWRPEDIERDDDGEEFVSEAAWGRVKKERMKALSRLVKEGSLQGRRTRKGLSIRAGSYYGWRGKEVPLCLDLPLQVEVVPDPESEQLRRWRLLWPNVQREIGLFPEEGRAGRRAGELRRALEPRIKDELRYLWAHLRAAQRVIAEAAVEFDGEDPCLPPLREVLEGLEAGLREEYEFARRLMRPFRLREPGDGEMDAVRGLVRSE